MENNMKNNTYIFCFAHNKVFLSYTTTSQTVVRRRCIKVTCLPSQEQEFVEGGLMCQNSHQCLHFACMIKSFCHSSCRILKA